MKCDAERGLTDGDWQVVRFWISVQDQVINLGTLESGGQYFAPRVEAWLAMMDLFMVPREDREDLLEKARYLHELVQGRKKVLPAMTLSEDELRDVDA